MSTDAAQMAQFLDTVCERMDLGRLPTDSRYWICLARLAVAGGDTVDVAGVGDAAEDALVRCAGEAVETLAQDGASLRPAGAARPLGVGDGTWLARLRERLPPEAVTATLLRANGEAAQVAVPAALVVRGRWSRAADDPPLSEGCAAAPDADAARLAAVLELVERDAVARWWRGGRAACLVAHDDAAARGGSPPRRVWTLDLGGGAIAPVAAMLSRQRDGLGFAFAAASRPRFAEACAAAARELALFELAEDVARRRPGDPRHHAHHARSGCAAEAILGRLDPQAGRSADLAAAAPDETLRLLAERAAGAGVAVALTDLSRPDLPARVFKAISPDLEPSRMPCVTARIAATRRRWGEPPGARAGFLPY